MPLSARYVSGEDILLAYLDLVGTKYVYSNFGVDQQIDRITQVIRAVREAISNSFGEDNQSIFMHMYADSLVIAQKNPIKNCAGKFIELMLRAQYQILMDSQYNQVENKSKLMPTLSRALIKRGRYYGLICSEIRQSIEDTSANFSLVGGAAVVEMDKALKQLPMGTYIHDSVIEEAQIEKERLVDIVCRNELKFVKPRDGFDFLRSTLSSPLKDWVEELIKSTGDNNKVREKIVPWADAIQKSQSINCHPEGTIC